MDKYEYKLRAEEIIRLAGKKQYQTAVSIADEIRWERVKNIQMLCTVSEIYEKVGRYEESKDVLLLAYNRSPNGKMIVYRLVELSIALEDYEEATDFYHEYVQMAPKDSNALVLKYKLYKGRGGQLQTLIAILEEFKTRDIQEEWILELARLYHQAGDVKKCVENCDDIDLWFGKGPRVIQALELKKMYVPLTEAQEQKLQKRSGYGKETPAADTVREKKREEPVRKVHKESEPVVQSAGRASVSHSVQEPETYGEVYEPGAVEAVQEPESVSDWTVYTDEPQEAPQPWSETVQNKAVMQYQAEDVPMPEPEPELMPQPSPAVAKTPGEGVNAVTGVPAPEDAAPEPKEEVLMEGAVADAIIQMAKMQSSTKIEKGFSILPKNNVVKKNSAEYAFDLPDGVEEMNIPLQEEKAASILPDKQEIPKEPVKEKVDKEHVFDVEAPKEPEVLEFEPIVPQPEEKESAASEEDSKPQEKPKGLFGKMLSKLTMEDDELDDDFYDDYEDDDDFEDDSEKDMVKRGLTGQYEKIVMDDEDDESDPLNARMTGSVAAIGEDDEEEEYEYIYGDEDEAEEYEEIEEEEEYQTKGNKRFRFFRNTMEDDELFEDEEIFADTEEDLYDDAHSLQEPSIPLSYAAKYDTLNLQKELAKSIQQLMDATEKETVDSTLENVKKMVEQSNIPELTETMRFKAVRGNMLNRVAKQQAERLEKGKDIESVVSSGAGYVTLPDTLMPTEDATVSMAVARPKPISEPAIKLKPSEEEENIPLDRILTQENDGQLSLLVPEEEQIETQITGQLNIEDVLKEWEKQKLLSENDKDKRALEEARKRALEETQGIMTEIMGLLKDVIPKIGAIKDGEEKMSVLAKSLEKVQKALPLTQGVVGAAEDSREAASAIEAACVEAVMELEKLESGHLEETTTDPLDVIEEEIEKNLPEGIEELAEEEEEPEQSVRERISAQEQRALQNLFNNAQSQYEDEPFVKPTAEEEPAIAVEQYTAEELYDAGEPEYAEGAYGAGEPEYAEGVYGAGEPEYAEGGYGAGESEYAEGGYGAGEPEYAEGGYSAGEPEYAEGGYSAGEPEYAEGAYGAGELGFEEEAYGAGEPEYAEGAYGVGEPGFGEEAYAAAGLGIAKGVYDAGKLGIAKGAYMTGEPGVEKEPYKYMEPVLETALTEEDNIQYYGEGEVSTELAPDLLVNDQMGSKERETSIPYGGLKEEQAEDELSKEQEEILAYFLAIKAIRPTLTDIVKRTEYAPEHMIVTGEDGSGRTSVAMRIIKASQVHKEEKTETIAKIKAPLLNQKKVTEILDKVNGGVLIIEQAGSLKPTTVYSIEEALYSERYYVQIILVDTRSAIFKLLHSTTSFLNDIQMCINLPVYSNNELAEFAKTYAQVNGYVFDEMAILALHSVIELYQTDQHAANLEDVKNIMDEAMERADRRSKKLFGKLFSKKNDDTVLLESDFE